MNFKKVVQFSIGPLASAALGFITLPFIAWFFSVEDVGRLTMALVIFGLSTSLIGLETHQAYVREYHEENNKAALFKVALIPGVLVYMFALTIVFVVPSSFSELIFGIDSIFLAALLFTGIFANFLINLLAHVIRMQERALAFSAMQVAPKAIFLILIASIFMLDLKAGFGLLLFMNVSASLATLFVLLWLTHDTWLPAINEKQDTMLLKRMLKFCLPLVAGGLAYWGLTTMDRFFLRSISGFGELGLYGMCVTISGSLFILSSIFSNIWHPTIYRWVNEGLEPSRVQAVMENMALAVAFLWSCFGVLSWVFPFFLPNEYLAIEYLVVACIAMPLFYMLSETTVVGIGITRRSVFSTIAALVSFLVNAVLNYLLIPEYGAAGAAIASLIAFFAFFLLRTEFSARLWFSFPRHKMYLLMLLYSANTIYMVFTEANSTASYFLWFVLFAVSLMTYYRRLLTSLEFLKINIKKLL